MDGGERNGVEGKHLKRGMVKGWVDERWVKGLQAWEGR